MFFGRGMVFGLGVSLRGVTLGVVCGVRSKD